MALVTIQILEGLERGRIFSDLPTPVTIGREEDNSIQLNDERISRFHTKIQDDGERIILTDLDSTNGTRVNGHPVQMRILQIGDQMTIGRCLLVYGSPVEISEKIGELPGRKTIPSSPNLTAQAPVGNFTEEVPNFGENADMDELGDYDPDMGELFPDGPPEYPSGLRPVQTAQLSDMMSYVHDQIRMVLEAGVEEKKPDKRTRTKGTRVDWENWQALVNLEMQLAVYLRRIVDPDS